MSIEIACKALHQGKHLELGYNGFSRIVEVHAVGYTKDDNAIMRVWQVSGGSNSGEGTGWKLMRLDKALSPCITDEQSEAPRSGYKRGDPVMQVISCQI